MAQSDPSDSRETPQEESPTPSSEETSPREHILEPENPLPPLKLADLTPMMREAVAAVGWPELTPVQSSAIPYLLAGRDMMVQARTGSGKTGAFILPILEQIDPDAAFCQALVLVPTRELAVQVAREAEILGKSSGLHTLAVYGGVAYGAQLDGFRDGAQLVVGTPGRILDHLLRGSLKLNRLRYLVFDEADRMLSMGFYPDMKQIQSYLPRNRQGSMFSATFIDSVRRLAREFLNASDFLSLSRDNVHVSEMDHLYYVVPPMDKDRCLVRIIEVENPASALIFCNTKQRVNYVATVLQRFGYDADQLTSELRQSDREKVMDRIKRGQLRLLVATDVAARGIDIPNLSHVYIYELPEEAELYIHRAGRTGRAGAAGIAVSLVSPVEESQLLRLAKRFKVAFEPRPVPTDEDVETIVSQRVVAQLEARLRARDRLHVERMQRMLPLARSLGENDDELAVIAMLLDDFYQETLHAPPPLPEEEKRPAQREAAPPPEGTQKRRRRRGGRKTGEST